MASLPEIKLNKETIGFLTGAIGLCVTIFTGYNYYQSGRAENSPVVQQIASSIAEVSRNQALKNQEQDSRLDRNDRDRERFNTNIKELTDKTGDLTIAVVKLTTILENSPTRKADLVTPIPLPSMPLVSVEAKR
jgi:hypothetical protein